MDVILCMGTHGTNYPKLDLVITCLGGMFCLSMAFFIPEKRKIPLN